MSLHILVLRYFSRLLIAILAFSFGLVNSAYAEGVQIRSYGHSSLMIKGDGKSVLLNPFKAVGCASGLKEPRVRADVILASSELADEGAKIAKGIFFVKPGSYRVGQLRIEGFSAAHDRFGGRRYGQGTVWFWEQGGFRFAHLGGIAAPLKREDKILLGRPDVLIIAVGGGNKAYNGQEAAQVVRDLNPKLVLPVNYLVGKKIKQCDQDGIQSFLNEMKGTKIKKVGKRFSLSKRKIKDGVVINIME